ncbi:MAG: Ig-like domain-containing protein [Terriglobales bacterium]|jgi:Big-like domain-containing protein
MTTRRGFAGKRLPLTLAFGVLVAAAIGAGCHGFFTSPTLTSLNISPSAPSVEVGTSVTLQAFGVYSDGTGNYLTSGVSWSCVPNTIATCTGSGSVQLTGVSSGTVAITASDQSVTSTASGTVYITISAISMTPTSQSLTGTTGTGTVSYLVYANNNNIPANNISSGANLTVALNGTAAATIGCSYNPADLEQDCTASVAPTGTYVVTATYPGTTLTATAKLIVP